MYDNTTPLQQPNRQRSASRQRAAESRTYRLMQQTARLMDRYYLDPIIGLIPGGVGDTLQTLLVVPFLWFSLAVVRSVPLTLALAYYALRDIVVGLIPFFLGDVLDVFNRSYARNMRLVQGFIDDDRQIVSDINRKAWLFVAAIILCIALIVLLIWLSITLLGKLFS